MESTGEAKNRLREHYLKIRKELSESQRQLYSQRIQDHLTSWKVYQHSQTIHCFLTIDKNGEVQTDPLLSRMMSDGKRVVVPRTLQGRELGHIHYRGPEQLKVNHLGIPEPESGEKVPAAELDLVLVPMLAGDPLKNRLGYGQGYYDRFLGGLPAVKAGLLFEVCISSEPLPVNSHDVPLDYLITEQGIR